MRRINRAIGASNLIAYYPIVVDRASGAKLYDIDGKEYMDFNASWTAAGAGYSDPQVIRAIESELRKSLGVSTSSFPTRVVLDLAEKLIKITPGTFSKKVWLGHSGSDAAGAVFKLLPLTTKRPRMISFFGSMHGIDLAGIEMAGHPATTKYPVPTIATKVPYAYCYRCPFGLEYPSCGIYCASSFIEEHVFKTVNPPEDTSFMIVEPIQSDAGDIVPPDGYFEKLKKTCEKFGILFVTDEVKVGMGRTGKMFGIEHSSVIPDAIILGKSLASGLPLSALITKTELLDTGFAVSTLGGNTISAAAGIATIDLIEKRGIAKNAERVGNYLLKRLRELQAKHDLIGDVRGRGLIAGLELVNDRKTKEPAKKEAIKLVYRSWQLGLLVVFLGINSNVVEITPPLAIGNNEVDLAVEILDKALSDVEAGRVSDSAVEGYTGF